VVRRKGTSRVSGGFSADSADAGQPQAKQFPSLRERRPVLFWIVILATLAMVLSTIASFASAFL